MPSKIWCFAAVAALGLLGSGGEARAQLAVCNKSSEALIRVAVGFPTAENGWKAAGWTDVPRGECRNVVSGELEDRYYYIYARGPNNEWEASEEDENEESASFCVDENRAFEVDRNRYVDADNNLTCEPHGMVAKDFIEVDVGDDTAFSYDLED
jgi:uncharacterized membrane protein